MREFLVIALVAYLTGAASAAFLIVVIGIRRADRPERILDAALSQPEASARRVLRAGTWPELPVYRANREDN